MTAVDAPSPTDEEAMFALWCAASDAGARLSFCGDSKASSCSTHSARGISDAAASAFVAEVGRYEAAGWGYSANDRRFVRHIAGIDSEFLAPWFMHRPVREGLELAKSAVPALSSRQYQLVITSPVTTEEITRTWLSKHLVRRFEEASAQDIVVVQLVGDCASARATASRTPCVPVPVMVSSAATEECSVAAGAGVTPTCVSASAVPVPVPAPATAPATAPSKPASLPLCLIAVPSNSSAVLTCHPIPWRAQGSDRDEMLGHAVAETLAAAVDAKPSLIVLDLRSTGADTEPVNVDAFIPAYPVLLSSEVIVFTPLQLLQVNACSLTVSTPSDVMASLLRRISVALGAVLVPDGVHVPPAAGPVADADKNYHASGISSFRSGMYKDGRIVPVLRGLAWCVPECRHGWLSTDTKVMLSAAIGACKPRQFIELGAWYGLSSGHIMTRAAEEGCNDMRFYSVDYFKNNAHYERYGGCDLPHACRRSLATASGSQCPAFLIPLAV